MNSPDIRPPQSSSNRREYLARRVFLLAVVPIIGFVLSYFGHWLLIAELLVNFQVQLFCCLLACAAALLLLRSFRRASIVLFVLVLNGYGITTVFFPGSQPPAGPTSIRIMSFNVLGANQNTEDVAREIAKHDPDILAVMEYTQSWENALRPLTSKYPHLVGEARWHGFGIALFSKLPLSDVQVLNVTPYDSDLPMISATMYVGEAPLQIVALHLVSPLDRVRWRLRNLQLVNLGKQLAQSSRTRIVVGDFNCTTWSNNLREFLVSTGLRDSRQGIGLHPSWHPGFPLLAIPIDHVFVSKDVNVSRRQLGNKSGSDHCPVIVDLSISSPGYATRSE